MDFVELSTPHDEELDGDVSGSNMSLQESDAEGANDPAPANAAPANAQPTQAVALCRRCSEPDFMGPHDDNCTAPWKKVICCVKCQCFCVTEASYLAHSMSCLGVPRPRVPLFKKHIVCFSESLQLGVCDACGVYRQRKGVMLDTHRHVCGIFINEHTGMKFPFMPAESAWIKIPHTYGPPQYYGRMILQLAQGSRWTDLETIHLAQLDFNWSTMECGAVSDVITRAPFYAGITMTHEDNMMSLLGASTFSTTSETTASSIAASTAATSDVARLSSVEDDMVETAVHNVVHATSTAEVPTGATSAPTGASERRVARTSPRPQPKRRTPDDKCQRGCRAGRLVREQRRNARSHATNRAPPQAAAVTAAPVGNNTSSGRNSPRTPLPTRQQRAGQNTSSAALEERRHQRRTPYGAPRRSNVERTTNIGEGGRLLVTSNRDDSGQGAELTLASGDAMDSSTATHGSRQSRSEHVYLEGAVHDHRTGLFVASLLVCGIPPTGTSAVVWRNNVPNGRRLSYYRAELGHGHIGENTPARVRAQALLFDTATKLPAGCVLFWELPPTRAEWLLRPRDDAKPNPDAEFIKVRFAPLRRA